MSDPLKTFKQAMAQLMRALQRANVAVKRLSEEDLDQLNCPDLNIEHSMKQTDRALRLPRSAA